MKSKKLKISNNTNGFSLLEMIIAIFIFSLVIVLAVSTFVNVVSVRKKTKETQQNMENARVAMSTIAKEARNNLIISANASRIIIYDDAQKLCLKYAFVSTSLHYYYQTVIDQSGCTIGTVFSGDKIMLAGNVTGKFDVIASVADDLVGHATIMMEVQNPGSTDKAKMQTTVSLRVYSQETNPT
jgi:prepilin-type N-terminal cleavage/methylation domain-containing protein